MQTEDEDLRLGANQKLILRITLYNFAVAVEGLGAHGDGKRARKAFDTILDENRRPPVQLLRIALCDLKEAYDDVTSEILREKLSQLYKLMDDLLVVRPKTKVKSKKP